MLTASPPGSTRRRTPCSHSPCPGNPCRSRRSTPGPGLRPAQPQPEPNTYHQHDEPYDQPFHRSLLLSRGGSPPPVVGLRRPPSAAASSLPCPAQRTALTTSRCKSSDP